MYLPLQQIFYFRATITFLHLLTSSEMFYIHFWLILNQEYLPMFIIFVYYTSVT